MESLINPSSSWLSLLLAPPVVSELGKAWDWLIYWLEITNLLFGTEDGFTCIFPQHCLTAPHASHGHPWLWAVTSGQCLSFSFCLVSLAAWTTDDSNFQGPPQLLLISSCVVFPTIAIASKFLLITLVSECFEISDNIPTTDILSLDSPPISRACQSSQDWSSRMIGSESGST